MKVGLTKIGDEYGIVLDDALLDQLNIGPDTPLNIETDGRALYIRPSTQEELDREAKLATPDTAPDPAPDPASDQGGV